MFHPLLFSRCAEAFVIKRIKRSNTRPFDGNKWRKQADCKRWFLWFVSFLKKKWTNTPPRMDSRLGFGFLRRSTSPIHGVVREKDDSWCCLTPLSPLRLQPWKPTPSNAYLAWFPYSWASPLYPLVWCTLPLAKIGRASCRERVCLYV